MGRLNSVGCSLLFVLWLGLGLFEGAERRGMATFFRGLRFKVSFKVFVDVKAWV